jgi:glycerophosphoryl diester phosphodiesterase
VFVQSFEVGNLQAIRQHSSVRLVQLVAPSGRPYDSVAQGNANTRSYADLITPAGLREVARYANAIGPFKTLVVPVKDGLPGEPTSLVAMARAEGLAVHIWTLRPENVFLPQGLRKAPASDPTVRGDSMAEIIAYLRAGIDGFFTDDPAVGRAAVRALTPAGTAPSR